MARYTVNDAAVVATRAMIDAKQHVLDSDWGDVQPDADAQNASRKARPARLRRLAPRPPAG